MDKLMKASLGLCKAVTPVYKKAERSFFNDWLEILWKGKIVQINSKGETRGKRKKAARPC